MDQVRKRKIEFADTIYVTRLLASDDQGTKRSVEDIEVKGVLGINIEKKEFVLFVCKSLILAAGGYTRVYSVSSSRVFENYGDGMALANEAGAELVDMEMVKFHPTGMIWPEKALGTLATEAIRGECGILLNSKGERFMKNYYPERMEL
jgi:succinate dehydrogenase / fumarate reductase, flavoprotein subunit